MNIFGMFDYQRDFSKLKGQTFTKVYQGKTDEDNDCLFFEQNGSVKYILTHFQDCCESVGIEDICGNLSFLEDSEILLAEESSNEVDDTKEYRHQTWTFYKLGTIKGYVDIRFYGESNGYYSETAELYDIEEYKKNRAE